MSFFKLKKTNIESSRQSLLRAESRSSNSKIDDTELLARLKTGEQKAVREWFGLYHTKLLHLIQLKISNPEDAQEIAQEVFLSCLKHLPLFRGESSIWTWMCRIANHEVADFYRKKYAKKAIHTLSLDEIFAFDTALDAHETSEKVKYALSHIRADYHELLLLKYVDKKKVTQIAKEMGKTVKSIESDLFRARNDFRQAYLEVEGK